MTDERLDELHAQARRQAHGVVESGTQLAAMLRRQIAESAARERRTDRNLKIAAALVVVLVFVMLIASAIP